MSGSSTPSTTRWASSPAIGRRRLRLTEAAAAGAARARARRRSTFLTHPTAPSTTCSRSRTNRRRRRRHPFDARALCDTHATDRCHSCAASRRRAASSASTSTRRSWCAVAPRRWRRRAPGKHLVQVAGVEHVALGADFEGGIRPAQAARTPATFPIWPGLASAGLSEAAVRKVFSEKRLARAVPLR